ncbi:MAG: 5-oxoprolinase/urea amidolyase family protein [Terracoccus sp.]
MTSRPRLRLYGDRALLLEVGDTDEAVALRVAIQRRGGHGVDDLVVGARTVLVHLAAGVDPATAGAALLRLAEAVAGGSGAAGARVTEIRVSYDGPDLDAVAASTGLSREEVVAAHVARPWRVGFGGFAPGFAYLVDGDPRLTVPRRDDPRTAVPAGSVALAAGFSAVYPSASPGGWQLIGRTAARVWDVDRDPPALFAPGDVVHFVDAGPDLEPEPDPTATPAPVEGRTPRGAALEVVRCGPLTLVEDLGRVGLGDAGVGRSGAADVTAYALGSRLVGQAPGPAALEVLLGGLSVRARGDVVLALTGARADGRVGGAPVPHAAPFVLADGRTLELARPARGLRTYLSVRGGVDVPAVLGSRSRDVLAGIGPPVVDDGDLLPVGPAPSTFPDVEVAPTTELAEEPTLQVLPGPRSDWFADLGAIERQPWTVSDRSNRVGIRLQGGRVERTAAHAGRELPTEGLVTGAIQVPPSGEPVLFLADHPVTGGYPVVAVVCAADLGLAAQLRPGQRLHLRWA